MTKMESYAAAEVPDRDDWGAEAEAELLMELLEEELANATAQ